METDSLTHRSGRHRFCPWCAAELTWQERDHKQRKACPVCDYVFWDNPVPAAGVILEREGKILWSLRRWEPKANQWSLPAGFLDAREGPEACAIRELREETGLEVRLTRLVGVYPGKDDPRAFGVFIVYAGEIISGEPVPDDDCLELGWFPLDRPPIPIAFHGHERALADYILLREPR